MSKNRKQHFVSQLSIRQFLGDRDRLFCLDKRSLAIPDRLRGNTPHQILWANRYYTVPEDDFDTDVIQPLETQFGAVCESFCNASADVDKNPTLIEILARWLALSIVRTQYFAVTNTVIRSMLPSESTKYLSTEPKAAVIQSRRILFDYLLQLMRDARMRFQLFGAPVPYAFPLTDHPACAVPYDHVSGMGPMLLPLGHSTLLLAIPDALYSRFEREFSMSLDSLTLFLCGWSRRLIYSSDLNTLDYARELLLKGGRYAGTEHLRRARCPHFGFDEKEEIATLIQLSQGGADQP